MTIGLTERLFTKLDCSTKNLSSDSLDIGKSYLNSPSWLCSTEPHQERFTIKSRPSPSKFFFEFRRNASDNVPAFRDRTGIWINTTKRHIIGRPSTAVRRHVKKITEEFTITQTKYENGSRPNGIVIHIEPSSKENQSPNHSGALNSIFSPKVQNGLYPQRKVTTCSKCEPSTNKVIPVITSPPVVLTASKSHSANTKFRQCRLLSSRKGPNLSAKRNSLCLSPSSPSRVRSCLKERTINQGENINICKFPRRKKSHSANPAYYGGLLKVPFEQVKKAKLFTENAVREGKVFAIHGQFPAIREALMKRGWVEKILHSIPYINPHPQNCVCVHIGWHISSPNASNNGNLPHQHHSASTNASSSTNTTDQQQSCDATTTASDSSSDPIQNEENNFTAETVIKNDNINENEENQSGCQINETDTSSKCKSDINEDNIEKTIDVDEQICETSQIISEENSTISVVEICTNDEEPKQEEISIKLEEKNKNESENEENINDDLEKQNEKQNVSSEYDSTNQINTSPIDIETDQEEYIKKLTKTINTAFLGPSEIRKGLYKSINKKNLAIFQYSVPPYERKRKCTYSKPDSDKKSSKTDDELLDDDINLLDDLNLSDDDVTTNDDDEDEKLKEEMSRQPYNPFPKLDYILTDLDKPVITRVLRNVEPNFIWSWNRDSISFKHLSKEQLVNRFPNTPFTTKFGLCETLQQLHWFSEAASVDTFVPRGYCIGHEDERTAFIHDYRTTACLNMLKWITEGSAREGPNAVAHPLGEVPIRRIRQALQHVERFIQSCCHDDLDSPPLSPLRETEWEALLNAHHRIIHQGRRVKAPQHHIEALIRDCKSSLARVRPFWPQLQMDGVRNVWIVKPGAQSRGRGIFLLNQLEEILALVHSPLIYQTKYVVQKYMERPLLIHNTKFDIRQWFMVTDWNPLTVWMYKESYLRFCSQQYDLTNCAEAIHLSNNAIQCKYHNGERDEELPEENMWDCSQFKEFLRGQGYENAYEEIIYPGMKDALTATMLAAQVEMDSFKHGFEFFGADFMLTEDLRPWLIEINSSPCMAPTTSVTKRMCNECLHDVIKVVVDLKQCKHADTGNFELIYQDKERSIVNMPYLGVSLQVTGRQIWRPGGKNDKRRSKRLRPVSRVLKSLPLVTLQLEESGNIGPMKTCPVLSCPENYSEMGPTLTTLIASPQNNKICESVKCQTDFKCDNKNIDQYLTTENNTE